MRIGIASAETLSRASLLKRGAVGGGAFLVAATGLEAFAPAALAGGAPDGDLAYLRLLIAAELLAHDFYGRVLSDGSLRRPDSAVARRIRSDEHEHYVLLAALMTADGQTPATAADIDFSYPAGTFASGRSVIGFAKHLERILVGAYVDALEHVQTPGYRVATARILASEAQHHGAVAALEGEPVIAKLPTPFRMDAMSNFLDRYES